MTTYESFKQIYLNILAEEKSPTTFTPEELLDDVSNYCYHSSGCVLFYSMDEMKEYAKEDMNKCLFRILTENMKGPEDFGMMVIYFNSSDEIDDILEKPHYPNRYYPQRRIDFIRNELKRYFKQTGISAANFNSIDWEPELGCIIGINGNLVKTRRDLEKVLDHEINHYYEGLNIHFDLADYPDSITDSSNEEILKVLKDEYDVNFERKSWFLNNLKAHMFNFKEFRSMSGDVFHEIIRYNETHLTNLGYDEFVRNIINKNFHIYGKPLKDYMIFSWICYKLSGSRWEILLKGIEEAIKIKKNIFQKFTINIQNLFKSFFK